MGMAVWLVFRYTSTFTDTNFWGSLLNLVVGTCVGVVVFLILALVLRMQEYTIYTTDCASEGHKITYIVYYKYRNRCECNSNATKLKLF